MRTKQQGQDGGDGGGLICGIGDKGVQSEGSTPLCLVLVTSLRLLVSCLYVLSLFVGPHTHAHTLASSRPGGTVCEWLGLLWCSHKTPVVLGYPVKVLHA